MLVARGATRWQLVRLTAVEAAPLWRAQRGGRRAGRAPAWSRLLAGSAPALFGCAGVLGRRHGRRGRSGDHAGAGAQYRHPRARPGPAAAGRRAIAGVTRAGAPTSPLILLAVVAGMAAAALLGGVGRGQRDLRGGTR